MADPDDEDWGLTLVVSRQRPTPGQMSRLLDLADGPGGIAALVAGDTQTEDGKLAPAVFQLAPDPDREDGIVATITLAYLGPNHQITVWPQTLTAIEYEAATAAAMMIAHRIGAMMISAQKRGTTRRRTGSIPSTRKASSSSRIARAPRSDAIAAAAAPPMSKPAVIGAPCLITPTPLAAPISELAPT